MIVKKQLSALVMLLPVGSLFVLTSLLSSSVATAQSFEPVDFPQVPIEELPAAEEELLQVEPATQPNSNPSSRDEEGFRVREFKFESKDKLTVFTEEDLQEKLEEYLQEKLDLSTGDNITFEQLLDATAFITQLYLEQGYDTSGAYLPEQNLGDCREKECDVTIRIDEGRLEAINVIGTKRLVNYIRDRLGAEENAVLNVDRLQNALQLLRRDPRIENISAELSTSPRYGFSILTVNFTEAPAFNGKLILDNNRNPSVGSFRRQAQFTHSNVLGLGDVARFIYANTDGSNEVQFNYTVPVNSDNSTLSATYRYARSNIIEEPFDALDIEVVSHDFNLSFRQPIIRQTTDKVIRDLFVGVSANRRVSDSSLLGVEFPLSLGADAQGRTRISALRFFQEYNQLTSQQALAARSEFSLGIDAFDATNNENAPDGQFFVWRGQFFWLSRLNQSDKGLFPGSSLLFRSDIQLTLDSLVSLEQFSYGGQNTVRGYRQDILLTDNGAVFSVEWRIPVFQTEDTRGKLQVAPFVDFGVGWNNANRSNPSPNALVGTGLGLQWEQELFDNHALNIRLDWGIPLVNIDSFEDDSWQENGVYLSLEYSFPF
ncbi:MAG: ShlB/FhaC/HecB family hemolysin secretion/activation protein [Symploca sp. SIO2E6]|nr:ShlB/FhaC/HecB family hemolysin secretion/activation protein [Symploca sp. SIO2E6]